MKFPTVQNLPEKVKNPDLIKSARKRNRENRKKAHKLFWFEFSGYQIGTNQFRIKFRIRKFTLFLQREWRSTEKSSQTLKSSLKFLKNTFVAYSRETGKCWNQTFCVDKCTRSARL